MKIHHLSPDHDGPVVYTRNALTILPGPCLTPTPTPYGSTRLAVHAGTLYVSKPVHERLTACDLDRMAALGHPMELS